MKQIFLILIVATTLSCSSLKLIKPDWSIIDKVEYYGDCPPGQCKDYNIKGNPNKLTQIFTNIELTDHFFPKGPSHYALIKLLNGNVYTIQIIRTKHSPFRILGKKDWENKWYELKNKEDDSWDKYIGELSVEYYK
jgi:hypothetical protein